MHTYIQTRPELIVMKSYKRRKSRGAVDPPLQKEGREETVFQNANNGGYVSSTLMEGVGLRMFHVNYPLVQ